VTRADAPVSDAPPSERLRGKRVAIPGKLTTAALLLPHRVPGRDPVEVMFDDIPRAVREREVDAGVIIHESQLTYREEGLAKLLDFGELWKRARRPPVPLGSTSCARDLGEPPSCVRAARVFAGASRRLSRTRTRPSAYALQFGRGLDTAKGKRFVHMYVNELTLEMGERGRAGLALLYERARACGAIPAAPAIRRGLTPGGTIDGTLKAVTHTRWDDCRATKSQSETFGRKLVSGEQITMAQVFLAPGGGAPKHTTRTSSSATWSRARLRFWIGDEEKVLDVKAGEVLQIPANVPHRAEAQEPRVRDRRLQPATLGLGQQDRRVPAHAEVDGSRAQGKGGAGRRGLEGPGPSVAEELGRRGREAGDLLARRRGDRAGRARDRERHRRPRCWRARRTSRAPQRSRRSPTRH
jgi:quercetin dioxygenase-like cupin family protein